MLKVSDEEFIECFRRFNGADAVAKELGLDRRNVQRRRRFLEEKYGIRLLSLHKNSPDYGLVIKHHEGRIVLPVNDGVVIVFSDAHFIPAVKTTAFRALLLFIKNLNPVAVICNGDAFDGGGISRFPRIGWNKKPTVVDELKAVSDSLTAIEKAAKGARLIWPLGNHDARFETRLAAVAGEYEGVQGFSLKDHFPNWLPCWSVFINDDTVIKHRHKNGIHATHNNTVWAGRTMVTGHLHSLKVTPFTDYNGDRWGVDTGTLAEPYGEQFQGYMEDNPRNWRSGFVVLTFAKGRLLWPEVVRVVSETEIDFRGQILTV